MKPDREAGQTLPAGWEQAFDSRTRRAYYVDHNNRITTWLNPTDNLTKPNNFELCTGDQLPYGWERIIDPIVGVYYSDHISKRNQWTNPVSDWRRNRNLSANSQHLYSNGQQFRLLEQNCLNNSSASNLIKKTPTTTTTPTTTNDTFDKTDISLGHTSDGFLEKSATTSLPTRNYSTVNSKYDAGLLDIMHNRFGRGSTQSVEV